MMNAAAQAQTPAGFNLVAYEGFNYGSGTSLLNANGGNGWSGSWSKSYQDRFLKTASTGFTYTGLSTQGLKAEFDSACYGTCNEIAALGRSFPLQNQGVVYIQFISVFEANAGFGTPGIRISDGGVGTGIIGAHTGSLMSICSPSTILSSSTASLSAQNFVVVRIDYNLNKTEMWVNPNLSTFDYSNPVSPSATASGFAPAFDRFDIFIRSGSIDEISIFAQPTSAPNSISGTTSICNGSSTTLTSSGGNLSSEGIDTWYQGACGGEAFYEGWDTQPASILQTTINSNWNGILNVTTTGVDPQINMFDRGSFDPTVYKYINFRYRVVSGTAGAAQFFFLNVGESMPDGSKYVDKTLISDNQWHTASVDMSANALWASGGAITGIRYDYATGSGATLDLDFIELSAAPIVGTGSSITVAPSATTTYYANRKGYTVNTICVSQAVTVNPLPSAPTATAIQRFCSSDTIASLKATVAAGETLEWYANATGGSALSPTTTLAAGNYYAQASSALGCSSARTLVVVSFNNALYFDGANDYVSLTSNSIPDGATAFTIEAWIKPDDLNFDGNWHAILGRQLVPGQNNSRVPSLYIKSDSNMMNAKIHLSVFEDTTLMDYGFVTPNAHIIPNVWSHLAVVKEGLKFKVYVNGIFVYEVVAPNAVNITGAYQIGYVDNYYAGLIDDVRFWNTSRSAPEISSNMNETLSGTETGLVDYYTFDQGIQNASNAGLTTLYDKTVSVNNGALNNFALTGATSNYVPGYFAQIIGTSTIQLGTNSQLSHVISGGSWTSSNTNIVTVSNSGLVTSVAVGSAIVSYTSCGQTTTLTITVTVSPPTISNFNNISKMYHDGSYSIVAPTSNSLGAFTYTSSNTAVATINGTTVTILGAGTSTITANQAADGNFSIGSIPATLTVTSVSVLTKEGGISGTNLNYVNQYGQIGGDFGLSANGAILNAKTPLSIGDSYGGGIVAYILVNGDVGYDKNVQHGIIAAVADQSTGAQWGCSGTIISGTSSAIGTGRANTMAILNGCSELGIAARICDDYSITVNGHTYNDWYLPSYEELNLLYSNRLAIGRFVNAYYWSSSETDDLYACRKLFSYGNRYCNRPKTDALYVRAIRSF